MEDVPLMKMDGDKRFKLPPHYFWQILSGDVNEHVEHLQEDLVDVVHYLLVSASRVKGNFCISCPYELDTQDPNLEEQHMSK